MNADKEIEAIFNYIVREHGDQEGSAALARHTPRFVATLLMWGAPNGDHNKALNNFVHDVRIWIEKGIVDVRKQ